MPGGWNSTGLTGGNEQYRTCRRKSVRFQVFQDWAASRISFFSWWNKEYRVLIFPILVNTIFGNRSAVFIYPDSIDFVPVQAAPGKQAAPLLIDGNAVVPLTIWKIPQNPQQKNESKHQTSRSINQATADEIARLIRGGQQNTIRLGDRPLVSGDIAILVRTAFEGSNIRADLAERGIRAVTIGKD
jgi:ATP-dependent exoDNAse (exonuclease V) beta subunit